jgi:transcriptional regulator with XRE-family HTH domain
MSSAQILQRKVREAKKEYTLRAFARKLKIPVGTMARLLNSPHNVTLRTLDKIAKALKTKPEELIRDEKVRSKVRS